MEKSGALLLRVRTNQDGREAAVHIQVHSFTVEKKRSSEATNTNVGDPLKEGEATCRCRSLLAPSAGPELV